MKQKLNLKKKKIQLLKKNKILKIKKDEIIYILILHIFIFIINLYIIYNIF